ncbi:hypothetical protein OAQ56_03565 [Alphaproteobacteria bacterium]|nr:hypothetical protein [Alphaproteobacteria bacterium]
MGDIIHISCKNCKDNDDYFVGMGMSGQLTNLYHCPKCNYLDLELDPEREKRCNGIPDHMTDSNIKNIYCSECKSSNIISVMNVIKDSDVPKYKCHKCGEKQLEVFPAGDWD